MGKTKHEEVMMKNLWYTVLVVLSVLVVWYSFYMLVLIVLILLAYTIVSKFREIKSKWHRLLRELYHD